MVMDDSDLGVGIDGLKTIGGQMHGCLEERDWWNFFLLNFNIKINKSDSTCPLVNNCI